MNETDTCANCQAPLEGVYRWRLEVVARKLQKRAKYTDYGVIRRMWGITYAGGKGGRMVTQRANPAWEHARLVFLCDDCMKNLSVILNELAPVVEIVPYEMGRED